jgi:hypothetical protein
LVEVARCGAGRNAELITQAVAELAVDVQGLSEVVLGGERLHEVAVAALSQGGEANELPAGPDGTCQLRSRDTQGCGCVAFEGADMKDIELVTDFVDPWGVLADEEVALGDEEGYQAWPPRSYPVVLGDRRLSTVDGLSRGFEINPRLRQIQPEGRTPVDSVGAEDAPELRQQRVEPGVYCGRVWLSPQRFSQLVSRDLAMAVDDEVGEQQPALAVGQACLKALVIALDHERPADLDAQGGL